MAIELERIVVRLMGDASSYMRMLDQAKRQTQSFADAMQKTFASAAVVGGGAAVFGGSIETGLASAVKQFSKFDAAMTESTAIMNVTDDQIKKMSETAIELAGRSKFGPDELAQAFYFLASAGMTAEQAIKALPIVMNFAQAGMMDMKKAAELAINGLTAMGLRSNDATTNAANLARVTDVLAKASKNANANTMQFATALVADAAPTMRSFNVSLEQGVAALMMYADQGIKNEVAGGHLARMLRFVAEKAIEHEQAFKKLGIAVFDVRTGALRDLPDILEDLETHLGTLAPQARSVALRMLGFEARIQRAILPLIGMSRAAREAEASLDKAGGTTQRISDNQMKGFANQMKLAWHQVQIFGISVGEQLVPPLKAAGQLLKFFVQTWRMVPAPIRLTVVAVVALTGAFLALGGAILVAGVIFNTLFGGVGLLIGGMVTASALFYGSLGGILIAVGYLSGAFEYLYEQAVAAWEWTGPVREALGELFALIYRLGSATFGSLRNQVAYTWNSMIAGMGIDWKKLQRTLVVGIKSITYAFYAPVLAWELIIRAAAYAFAFMDDQADYLFLNVFPAALKYVGDQLIKVFTVGFENVGIIMMNFWENFTSQMLSAGKYLGNVFLAVGNYVIELFKGIFTVLATMFTRIPDLIRGKISLADLIKPVTDVELKMPQFNAPRMRPLTQGIRKAMIDAFDLPPRELDERVRKLGDELDEVAGRYGVNLGKFMLNTKSIKEQEELAQEAGKDIGQNLIAGTTEGLKKFDAAVLQSTEALGRVLEFRERIQHPDQFPENKGGKGGHVSQLPRFDAADARTSESRSREQQQTDLLRQIAQNTAKDPFENKVELKDANINV